MFVSETALMRAEQSIMDKPLVWIYDQLSDDAGGHSKFEVPAGFVPKHSANISYERSEDGRLFFVVDVLIWKYYCGKLLEIFEKTDSKKSVSVEIIIIEKRENDDGKTEIVDFAYVAICVLGEKYTPAIPLANAQIVQFSQDKEEVERILSSLEKEDDKVSFNREEFLQKFSMTANELWELLRSACQKEKFEDWPRYCMCDYDDVYIYAYDCKESKYCGIPFSISEGKVECDFENVKNAKQKWVISDNAESVNLLIFAEELLSNKIKGFEDKIEELSSKVSALEAEKNELTERFSALEEEKQDFEVKIAEKDSELETLLEFKANVEKEERQNQIEMAINTVADDLTQEQIDEWRNKVDEFSSIEEFGNAIAAFAYKESKGKNKTGDNFTKMSLPDNSNQLNDKENKSLWERI